MAWYKSGSDDRSMSRTPPDDSTNISEMSSRRSFEGRPIPFLENTVSLIVGCWLTLLLAWLLVIPSVRNHMGISSDSFSYVSAAGHLVMGQGLFVGCKGPLAPLTHFPPLTSVVLALPMLAGFDWLAAGRTAAAVSYIALIGGLFAALWHFTRSLIVASYGLIVTGVHPTLLRWVPWILSDVLGAAVLVAFLFVLTAYVRRPSTRRAIVLGALGATAILVRYAYMGFVLGGVICSVTVLPYLTRGVVWRDVLLPWVVAAIPVCTWMVRNFLVAGTLAKAFGADPRVGRNAYYIMSAWWPIFVGRSGPGGYANLLVLIPVTLMSGLALLWLVRQDRTGDTRRSALAVVSVVLFISYSVTILILRSTIDPVQLDDRMFLPLVPLIVAWSAAAMWKPEGLSMMAAVAAAVWVVLLVTTGRHYAALPDGARVLPIASVESRPYGTLRVGAGSGTRALNVIDSTATQICRDEQR
jgi:hypothetical protein